MHTNRIGDITQTMVSAALLESGYVVLVPIGEHRYDLVIENDGIFRKVQVKTGRIKKGCVVFCAYSVDGSNGIRKLYTAEEIDLYAVYCPDNRKSYLVPISDTGTEGRLRIDPTKNNQANRIRWAEPYELLPVV